MRYHMKLSEEHITEIKALLQHGFSDREIGQSFGKSKDDIYKFRKRFDIPAKCIRKSVHIKRREFQQMKMEPLYQLIEDGIRITKCPPAWAMGIKPQKNLRQID